MTIVKDAQEFTPGTRVELFDVNFMKLGSALFHFCSSYDLTNPTDPKPVRWRGINYSPIPIEASGFEYSGKGTMPRPTLKISNVLLLPSALINQFGDPLGAKVTRWVTFSDYLDNGATPDDNQHFPPEIFVIDRKKSQNKLVVEFELASVLDQQGKKLPGRQVLAGVCTHTYRVYGGIDEDGADYFNYIRVTCPYVASVYYKGNGEATANADEDECGKRLVDCKLRFGIAPLPYRGFPAVGGVKR